jgi:glycosyltransferase involved in cell wall biosynthesis
MDLSLVIPVYNEVESLAPLKEALDAVTDAMHGQAEYVFVDDGSTDGSFEALQRMQEADPARVRLLAFRRNMGKSAALAAAFDVVQGTHVVTLDADLQDDPREIPALLDKMQQGFDLVCGWKRKRHDPLSKTLPSRLFNAVTAKVSGVALHDFNTGLKAYRLDVVRSIHVYGELHRFIPVLAAWQGFRVAEIPVQHHARRFGTSKFGPARFLNGFFDLVTVMFLTRRARSPLHFFGLIALGFIAVGGVIETWFLVQWLLGSALRVRPLLLLGAGLIVIGLQIASMGLLAEMITAARAERQQWSFRDKRL